jgi:CRP-like cAMP-binding protein
MGQDLIIDAEAFEAFGMEAPQEDAGANDTAAGTGGEDGGNPSAPLTGDTSPVEGRQDGATVVGDDEEEDGDDGVGADGDPPVIPDATGGSPSAPTDGGNAGDAEKREHNARNAERRRRNEAKIKAQIAEAAEAARREARAGFENAVKGLGITDPATGEAVDSLEKLEKYKAARVFEQARDGITNGYLTPEAFNALVEQTPAFQKAAAAVAQAEQAQAEARKTQAEAEVARQIEQIGRYDPAIKSIDDILGLDKAGIIREYVFKGLTIDAAYRLAYMDELMKNSAQATLAHQEALAKSKERFKPIKNMQGADVTITEQEIQDFKAFEPDKSREEIIKILTAQKKQLTERM